MQKSLILILSLLNCSSTWSASFDMLPYAPAHKNFLHTVSQGATISWISFMQGYRFALANPNIVNTYPRWNQDQRDGFVVARKLQFLATQNGQILPANFEPVIPNCYELWREKIAGAIADSRHQVGQKSNKDDLSRFEKYNQVTREMANGLLQCQIPHFQK